MQLRAEVTAVRKSSIFYPLVPTLMGLTSSGADIEYFIGNDYRKMGKPLGLLEHVVLQTGVHWRTSEKVHTCYCSFMAHTCPWPFGLTSTHPSKLSLDFRSF